MVKNMRLLAVHLTMTTPCIAGLSSPAVERWVLGIEQSGD